LPGCGAHRPRATPGSSPRIPCTSEVVPELILTILDGNTRASSSRTLAPLQGAISHPTLFRRSRPASTLRLPSFTPSGWGNRRLKDLFLNLNLNLNRNLPFFLPEGKPRVRLRLRLRLRLRPAVRTRRVHRRLPGCGAHRPRATPGSSPRIPCTPEVVPELIPTISDCFGRQHSGELIRNAGTSSRCNLIRRSSGGLAQPRRSGYHLPPLRGGATVG
jgi:hypothetical protein